MAKKPTLADSPHVLIVEGYGDLLFYAALFDHLRLPTPYIEAMGGKALVKTNLPTFLRPDRLEQKKAIALIVDADDDPKSTKDAFEALLSKITGQSVRAGQWSKGSPRIGLFITPSPDQKGEIETLVWQSWAAEPGNAQAKACIEAFVACMKAAGHQAKSPDKGLISAWLAIKSDEDPRLGPGARDGAFDLGAPGLSPLGNFLKQGFF